MKKIRCAHDKVVPITELVPHPKNRNQHPGDQVVRLAQILEYQGWRYPVKVSLLSGYITSGHGRLLAAKHLGWTEVPVNYQEYESEEQEYADVIADNSIASWAELDLKGINLDVPDLGPDFDLDLLGIKDFVLEPADKDGQCDEDEVPQVQDEAHVKLGDLFLLGSHRLLCGDSTQAEQVERLMNGVKADMVFTSPPYNGNTRFNPGKGGSGFGGGKNLGPLYQNDTDNRNEEEYLSLCRLVLAECFNYTAGYLFWNVSYNTNSRSLFLKQIIPFLDKLVETICWKKTALPVPYGLTRTWEPIFVFHPDENERIGHPNETEFNFWEVSNCGALSFNHRAAFPVELPIKAIGLCDPGSVLDPFLGSGSTLIACEKTNRRCYGMEIDPIYCGVILDRWAKYTGKDPVREDGVKWSEIKNS